jgi:hypothetical protein
MSDKAIDTCATAALAFVLAPCVYEIVPELLPGMYAEVVAMALKGSKFSLKL